VISTYSPTGLGPRHMIFVIYLPLLILLLAARSTKRYGIPAVIPVGLLLVATSLDAVNTFRYHGNLEQTGGLGRWSPTMYQLIRTVDEDFSDHNILIGNWGIQQQLDFFSRHKLRLQSLFGYERGLHGIPESFFRRVNTALLSEDQSVFIFHGPEYEGGFVRRAAFLNHLQTLGVTYTARYIKERDDSDLFHLYIPDQETIDPAKFSMAAHQGSLQLAEAPRITAWGPRRTDSGKHFNLQSSGNSAIWIQTENATIDTILVFDGVHLRTTFGSSDLLTAVIPPKLYAKEGRLDLYLLDPSGGVTSNVTQFVVDP